MEGHPNFQDYGHFSDYNQIQKASIYNGLLSDDVAEDWRFEDPHYEAGIDDDHSQPVSVLDSENGSAQSSFLSDFTTSQSSSHTALSYARNSYLDLTWVQQQATEAYNWPPTSNVDAAYTNFGQEINNRDITAKSPRAAMPVPSYNIRPLQITSSPITFQQLDNERVEASVYAPQQGFETFLDRESGENPRYMNSLNNGEMLPQQPNSTTSRSQSATKPKLRVSKFYCNTRPCNHQKAFARKADLERHLATQHSQHYPSKARLSQCPWLGCARKGANGFRRRDKMLQHQDRVHGRRL